MRSLDIDDHLETLQLAITNARTLYAQHEGRRLDDLIDGLNVVGDDVAKLTRRLFNIVDEHPLPTYRDPNAEHRLGVFETV